MSVHHSVISDWFVKYTKLYANLLTKHGINQGKDGKFSTVDRELHSTGPTWLKNFLQQQNRNYFFEQKAKQSRDTNEKHVRDVKFQSKFI